MGFGYLESVYQKCMEIELQKARIEFISQMEIVVRYENKIVGNFIADLLIEGEIIVELKSVKRLIQSHEVQLVNYLTATGKSLGLLINFGETKVDIKRKVRQLA
jgi:GxxExxY protein